MTDDMGDVRAIRIEDEMRVSYLDYAMSVIVARALPDVRDGLKPVQRRILYAMGEMGLSATSSYRKCAAIVGEVMGKYHPHGDVALYDALVRLAQDFSMRYPLVDGQGNFGASTATRRPPCATRRRASPAIAAEMLADIDKDTVDFEANYDGTQKQPSVLPAKLPEPADQRLVRHRRRHGDQHPAAQPRRGRRRHRSPTSTTPTITTDDLCQVVKGPDFPTGASIFRFETRRNPLTGEQETIDAIREMYADGRGRVVMRAQVAFEETRQRPHRDHRHGAAVPGEQGDPRREDRRARQGQEDRRHQRPARRVRPRRHAHRHRAQARRQPAQGAEQAVQAHVAADGLRRQHARARRRRAADAAASRASSSTTSTLRREVIRRRTEFDLEKARDRAHILEGLQDRARQPRRGHRRRSARRRTPRPPATNLHGAASP